MGLIHFDPCDLEKYVKSEVNLSVGAHVSDAGAMQI